MATLTIRDLDDSTIARLKELAAFNNRSMEKEARHLLESLTIDRLEALKKIEQAWKSQKRPTRRREVDEWLEQSRP